MRALKPELPPPGDLIEAGAKGTATYITVALRFIQPLARISGLHPSPVATRVLARLLSECDEQGVWRPKQLKALPRTTHRVTYHMYPLQAESKSADSRLVDVTFRLALIARLLGWPLEYR